MGFKERLREARINKGYTSKALANIIGITPSALTNYEKGYSFPNTETLYRLFRALDVEPNFLFQDVCETNTDAIKSFSDFEENFYSLNRAGKLKLIDYSEVLLGNPKYKKEG